MMLLTTIKINENVKRILIFLSLFIILFFVFVGAISIAIQSLMKKQGEKADVLLQDVTKAEYFKKEKQYKRFGIKKNIRYFYKRARIPFFVMLLCGLSYVLYCLFGGAPWGYNPFNSVDGFGSIMIRFGKFPTEKFFHIRLISNWAPIIKPNPTPKGIFSYIMVPILITGAVWYLCCVFSYIARSFRIRKIAKSIYRKKLVVDEQPTISNTETNN